MLGDEARRVNAGLRHSTPAGRVNFYWHAFAYEPLCVERARFYSRFIGTAPSRAALCKRASAAVLEQENGIDGASAPVASINIRVFHGSRWSSTHPGIRGILLFEFSHRAFRSVPPKRLLHVGTFMENNRYTSDSLRTYIPQEYFPTRRPLLSGVS